MADQQDTGFADPFVNSNASSSAKSYLKWDCLVFHDLDMLPMDLRNVYNCSGKVRNIINIPGSCVCIDKNLTKYLANSHEFWSEQH